MGLTIRQVKDGFRQIMVKEYVENGLEFDNPSRLDQAWKDHLKSLETLKMITGKQSLKLHFVKWTVRQ
jgi:hypothetical protein